MQFRMSKTIELSCLSHESVYMQGAQANFYQHPPAHYENSFIKSLLRSNQSYFSSSSGKGAVQDLHLHYLFNFKPGPSIYM